MFDFSQKDINKYKIMGYLSLLLVFIILFVFGVRYYFSKSIISDWSEISEEKKKEIHVDCLNLFYNHQNNTAQFSYQLIRSKKLLSAFSNYNTRKTYEALYEFENVNDYNVEIYNSRLELFLFSGRQVNPDVTELKKALAGERYSKVKEVGIYTYIVIFDPLKNESGAIDGILVTSSLLDINYDIQTRFFKKTGIKREIFEKYHIDVNFDFNQIANSTSVYDTSLAEFSQINLKNINNEPAGKIIIPNLDQSSYLLSVINKFDNIIGFLVFVLNLILIYWAVTVSFRADSLIIRILFASTVIIVSRFLWLLLDFPGKLFNEMGSDIFSPIHYASGILLGMSRSLGELFISSIVFTAVSLFIVMNIIRFYRTDLKHKPQPWLAGLISVIALIVCTLAIHFYGVIIQSLIFDSTLKFIEKSDIFSLNQPELVAVRLIILCFSATLLLIIVSCGLLILKYINPYLKSIKFARKNSAILLFSGIIVINLILSLLPDSIFEFSLKLNLRIIILSLAGLFTLYIQRQYTVTRDYTFINVVNFSLVLLACVIFVPAVLLNKITSLENRYLEKAAKEVSQQSSDKISFLISSTLEEISDDSQLEKDISDKNKYSKLAFNIWAKSKFYDEDLNSAVFVLDTNKKLISDFNINPDELVSDSVVSFTLRSLNLKQKEDVLVEDADEEEAEMPDINQVTNTMMLLESGDVLQNKEMKFYS